MRNKMMALTFVLILALSSFWMPAVAYAAPVANLKFATQATVQVLALDEAGEIMGLGSGSLISRDGLILTNHHVVAATERQDDLVGVRVPQAAQRNQFTNFLGKVVTTDEAADLALVQIVALANGKKLDRNLKFPTVPLGDSDTLEVGEEVYALGYPDIGNNQLVVTRGMVSGIQEIAGETWILSDVVISNGNSGGMLINGKGELVAVPTRVKPGEQSQATMAYLRPINAAQGLIKAAQTKGTKATATSQQVVFIGGDVTKLETATINGKKTREAQKLIQILFVDAQWTLTADGHFRFAHELDAGPIAVTGEWQFDKQKNEGYLTTKLFKATLLQQHNQSYLYVKLDIRTENGDRLQAKFYQAISSQRK